MHALQLASQTPSALLDWNNNYATIRTKRCASTQQPAQHFFKEFRMDFQEIIAGTVGKENTFGTVVGRVKSGPMSFARFSTNDREGKISGYVGEGAFTEDSLETLVVPRRPHPRAAKLLRFICRRTSSSRCCHFLPSLLPSTKRQHVICIGTSTAQALIAGSLSAWGHLTFPPSSCHILIFQDFAHSCAFRFIESWGSLLLLPGLRELPLRHGSGQAGLE